MKQIILVRHAEPATTGDAPSTDPPLSERGERQALTLAARLADEPIDRIVASPLERAHATARPLAEALGNRIELEPGVAEVDQEGARYVAVEAWRKAGGAEWRAFLADPVGALGGDHDAFVARVRTAFAALLAGPGRRVVIFTHGLPINVALADAIGWAGDGTLARFGPRHASITRMAAGAGGMNLLSFNEATHFPAGGA